MPHRKALVTYGCIEFIFWLAYGIIFPALALYLKETRGLSLAQVGTLWAWFWLVVITLQIPTGLFADRYGRKTAYIAATSIGCVALGLHALTTTYAWLFLSMGLYAIARAGASGIMQAWVIEHIGVAPNDALAQARITNIEHVAFASGMGIGSLAGGVAVAFTKNYATLYAASALLLGIAAFVTRYIIQESRADASRAHASRKASFGALARESLACLRNSQAIQLMMLFGFSLSLSFSAIGLYWPLHIRNVSPELMAPACKNLPHYLLFLCAAQSVPAYAESIFNVLWFLGIMAVYLACRKGHAPYLVLALWSAAYGINYAALAWWAHSAIGSLVCLAAIHATFGGCIPLTRQMFNAVVPNHIRATLLSMYFICSALGVIIGQFCVGLALERFSYGWVWGSAAFLFVALAAGILWRLKPHVASAS